MREVLEDVKKDAKKGRDAANERANDVASLLDSYKQTRQGYLNEMSSAVDQIHNINSDVDLALIDISTDCIDKCKTGEVNDNSLPCYLLCRSNIYHVH